MLAEAADKFFTQGEEAANVLPPYGIAMYPDAKVRSAMLSGVSMLVEVQASTDQLQTFYAAEIDRLGFGSADVEIEGKTVRLTGKSATNPTQTLTISIRSSGRFDDRYVLVFAKMS